MAPHKPVAEPCCVTKVGTFKVEDEIIPIDQGINFPTVHSAANKTDPEAGDAGAGKPVNRSGKPYPSWLDPRTGKEVKFPAKSDLVWTEPNKRVQWHSDNREGFIKEWYDRGYAEPQGGWEAYEIHHIQPLEFGGDNNFWNLVPVETRFHQAEFTPFWKGY